MKIYFSHKHGMTNQDLIYKTLKESKFEFILPHEFSDGPFNSKVTFENHDCTKVLAEVSEQSTGQGIELGWADMMHIPIICISREGTTPSNSLKVVSSQQFRYSDVKDLASKLESILND